MTGVITRTYFNQKDHIKERGLHRYLITFLLFFMVTCLSGAVIGTELAEAAYTIDTHYTEAVPDFIDAAMEATVSVKDEEELEEIFEWEQETRARLPEFLDDLITIAQQLEEHGSYEFILEEYTAFSEKWNDVVQSYPGLEELEPVLQPIIDQLLAGLPTLQANDSSNPINNLYEYYQEILQLDPWGMGSFWYILPVDNALREQEIVEYSHEKTVKGYKRINIIRRDTVATLNGSTVFSESIEDGTVIDKSVVLRDPSIIHETLEEMITNGEDPELIAVIQELVDLIDLNLKIALDNGVLDDCSYSFIYRKKFIGTKDTCTDIFGNEQDFSEISQYTPFDHVNQVQLSYVDPMAELTVPAKFTYVGPPPQPVNIITNDPDDGNKTVFGMWFVGVMIPAYLWSIVGFTRLL